MRRMVSIPRQLAYLFNASGSYPSGYANAKMRLYYCRIYDGDMLVRNFVPCRRNSDGVLGVYDRVNDVFYANAGSDTFTAGSETGEIIGVIHSTARKITRIYKGVDDVAQLLWSEGAALKSFAIAYLADDVTWNLSVEEGMTWGDWIDSEYNTIAACPVNTGIRIPYEDVKDGYIYVNHVVLDEYVAVAEIAAEIAEGVTYPCSKLRPAPPPML